MKIFRLMLLLLIFIAMLSTFLAWRWMSVYAPKYTRDMILEAFGPNVSFGRLQYDFPLELTVYDLSIGQCCQASEITLQGTFSQLFKKPFAIKRMVIHQLQTKYPIVQSTKDDMDIHPRTQTSLKVPSFVKRSSWFQRIKDSLDRMVVRQLEFVDGLIIFQPTENHHKWAFQLQDLYLQFQDVEWPLQLQKQALQFRGILYKEGFHLNHHEVQGSGWVNWLERDMDLLVRVHDGDGKTGLTVHAVADNNQMIVEGEILAEGFIDPPEDKFNQSLNTVVMGALSSLGISVNLHYQFETLMDEIKISEIQFTGELQTQRPLFESSSQEHEL